MSILDKATSGVQDQKHRWLLFGEPGAGKTTLACSFPKAVILDIEDGSSQVNVFKRIGSSFIPDWKSLLAVVDELATLPEPFETVVLDSLTAIEKLCESQVCADFKVTSLAGLDWGKGPAALKTKFADLINKLKILRAKKNVSIIWVAHAKIKPFNDPTLSASYDRYVISANQDVAGMIEADCDNVIFCRIPVETTTINGKTKGVSNDRRMYTEFRGGHLGKNRLNLPYELPTDYKALMKAIEEAKPREAAVVKEEIMELLAKADDLTREKVTKALELAGNDQVQVNRIKQKLITIVS